MEALPRLLHVCILSGPAPSPTRTHHALSHERAPDMRMSSALPTASRWFDYLATGGGMIVPQASMEAYVWQCICVLRFEVLPQEAFREAA